MKKQLQNDVAGKYQVLEGHGVGEYQYRGETVHLDALSLPEADRLVSKGFPYLVTLPVKTKAVRKRK
ncbi:hypothetical protein EOD41_10810 [Mucilaginibacter limnophilus]|uniref:Uncharacterized protein n=1 Tax=Mucilaginibacter limnophilus TaxID=1932778 RepID=A0A437MTW2_9SPHI|nr:hypothetical protein [Mucilaginibacter limnophilus]RVU01096.1 hypothetical protein EOD41_10810 [Mucilaginibacter limnophilus]